MTVPIACPDLGVVPLSSLLKLETEVSGVAQGQSPAVTEDRDVQ